MTEDDTDEMGRRKQGRRSNGCGGLKLHGNTWYARYTDALGNRREVSTHTGNKEEAYKILATYTTPIRESRSQEEMKLRLQQQIDVIELRSEVAKIERLKLDDLVAKFLNHRELADTVEQTKKNYMAHLNALVESIAKVKPNAKYIDDVTGEVADMAMCELTRRYTPSSYNLALATYRRAWSLFSRSNPFAKIGKRKIDRSRQRQVVTKDDIKRIFDSCRDDKERAVWGVGIYTGLRCGDVSNLTYGALGKDLRTITWTPQKTKRHMSEPLVIPVCSTLKGLLTKVLDWSKIGNDEFKEEPLWIDYKNRYESNCAPTFFKRTLEKAGLKTSHIDKDGHRTIDTGFHCTRHFFVTTASKYMSPLLVQRIVGHSSISMTEHYFHTNTQELSDGMNQMPDFTNGQTNIKSEEEKILDMLNSVKREGESRLECLKRLIENSVRKAC